MNAFQVGERAARELGEIYIYTRDVWGIAQAEVCLHGLFERFQSIADKAFPWRSIPAQFGIDGYVCRYERHFIYWKILADGDVGIVTVLHDRMHRTRRFLDAFKD